jgi:Sec-independent protein translocase protein TatA
VGALEIFLFFSIVLLILGSRRIIDLGRALGRGVRGFKLEFGRDKKRSAVSDQLSAKLKKPMLTTKSQQPRNLR